MPTELKSLQKFISNFSSVMHVRLSSGEIHVKTRLAIPRAIIS